MESIPSFGGIMSPKQGLVRIGSTFGYLYESTFGGGLCFVPEHCLVAERQGRITIDEVSCISDGWARRNARLNPALGIHRLFPNMHAGVSNVGLEDVERLLEHCSISTYARH